MSLPVVAIMLVAGAVAVSVVCQSWAGRAAVAVLRGTLRLTVRVVVMALPLPGWLLRMLGAAYGDLAVTALCENGCGQRVSLVGLVECSCGYRSVRNAFAPCVACGVARRFLACPHCGVGILRPGWTTQDFEPRRYR